jgi:hypothetical protein
VRKSVYSESQSSDKLQASEAEEAMEDLSPHHGFTKHPITSDKPIRRTVRLQAETIKGVGPRQMHKCLSQSKRA